MGLGVGSLVVKLGKSQASWEELVSLNLMPRSREQIPLCVLCDFLNPGESFMRRCY